AFAPVYERWLRRTGQRPRTRQTPLARREMLTRLVSFPWSHARTLKHDSTASVMAHLHPYYPPLVGSQPLVPLIPPPLAPRWCDRSTRQGPRTGMAFLDSTPLPSRCATSTAGPHTVLAGIALRGKTSLGGFVGCTRPLLLQDEGALLALRVTPGHVEDCQPV